MYFIPGSIVISQSKISPHMLSDHQPISSKLFYCSCASRPTAVNLHWQFSSCSTRAFISPSTLHFHLAFPGVTILRRSSLHRCLRFICLFRYIKHYYKNYLVISLKLLLINGFADKCCWRQPFSPTLKQCLGCLSLGEKRWSHPLPLAIIPPGAWHRHTPPCLCALWHPSHGLICHSLTLALSTVLTRGRQLSGPGPLLSLHLSPT